MLEKINHKSAPKEVINALISLYDKGELEQILTKYSNLTKIYRNSPEIYIIFGAIHYKLDRLEKAINYFLKGISLDPHNPDSHSDLGLAFLKVGKHESAIKSFKKAIKIDRNFYQAYDNLGQTNYLLKKHDDAISYYKKSLMINPKNDNANLQIGKILFETDSYYEALTYFEKYFDTNPKCPEIITYIVTILYKIGEYHIAFNYIREGLNYYPNSEELINLYGVGLHAIGKYKLSKKYFQKILKIEKTNLYALVNLIQLSGYDRSLNYSKLLKNFFKATKKNSSIKSNQKVVCLLGFGRSGSLFLHSLLDGHPQISTLPGYFFKGWFGEKTWSIFQPNFQEINWRETLVEKICTYFEPQFNAHCKKNVIGKPNGNTEWFAKNLGFTQLGENHSEVLELDQQKFKSKFIDLSQAYDKIDSRICFELIHEAFDKAYRIPENSTQKDKTIFYHLHNPNYYEFSNFLCNYPSAKFLYVIRNPIQMLESWIAGYINKINKTTSSFQNKIYFNLIVKRITRVFHYMYDPFNDLFETRGVKLEDIKRNYQDLIPNLKNWIGVDYHTALEKSEFLNSKFSRPSASMDMISGFDTRSIDIKIGRFFSNRDIEILETLFWPFMKLYGYTEVSEKDFHQNLKKIKPLISEPLDIEINYFSNFENNNINIKETSSFKLLHQNLLNAWNTLDQNMTYPYLIKKL